MEQYCLEVPEEYEEVRIDKCVSELMGDKLSRSRIQSMIKENQLLVNGKPCKASLKVMEGDEIAFSIPDPLDANIMPEDIPLSILYEDEDVIVVNKPKGMVVHPSAGHYTGTLVNALMYHCKDGLSGINGVLRPGIVHRIDMDTSGSLLVCKNDAAHTKLAEDFKVHSITRQYIGIVMGNVKNEEGTIEGAIGRHPVQRKKMALVDTIKGGKRAVTHYKVLEHLGKYTLCQFTLETGRTHQIRVHMASIGHPLYGDVLYGGTDYKGLGQMLHAKLLGFEQPTTGEYVEVDCPMPEYFEKCLNNLRMNL